MAGVGSKNVTSTRIESVELPDRQTTTIEWFEPTQPAFATAGFLPALGVSRDYYRALGAAWAQQGWRAAIVEMRGMRHSSVRDVRRNDFGYHKIIEEDLPTIVGRIRDGASQFFLAGHSLGGQFALLYAARYPRGIDGAIVVAGGSNYYGSMPPGPARWKRRAGIYAVRLVNGALGYFPGDMLRFGGRQPHGLMSDWSHEARTGKYRVEADADYDASLSTLAIPVLIISVRDDPLVPRDSADFLVGKLARASVTQRDIDANGTGRARHFRWARQPHGIVGEISQWADALRSTAK